MTPTEREGLLRDVETVEAYYSPKVTWQSSNILATLRLAAFARDQLADATAGDDGAVLSTDWLASVGFTIEWLPRCTLATIVISDYDGSSGDAHSDLQLNLQNDSSDGEWITDVYSYDERGVRESSCGLVNSWCKTRGDVRSLCKALGISLKE